MSILRKKNKIFRMNLRNKILFFFLTLALIPLLVSSKSMITMTRDELKSSVNDSLINTSDQLAKEIDDIFIRSWQTPLLLIRHAIDNQELGVKEKVSLLETSIRDIKDFVCFSLVVGDFPPAVLIKEKFRKQLEDAKLLPSAVLRFSYDGLPLISDENKIITGKLHFIPEADIWLLPLLLPLQNQISGYSAALEVQISIYYLRQFIQNHPFNKSGIIYLIDEKGQPVFRPEDKKITNYSFVQKAKNMITAGLQTVSAEPFIGPSGKKMLGSYAIPLNLKYAVVVIMNESDAYMAIEKMQNYLIIWLCAGLLAAVIGAVLFSRQITRPILEISNVVRLVGQGNLNIKVRELNTRDEISSLGLRINEMIQGLLERFHLQKFVSGQTLNAVKHAGGEGIKLGGERKFVTVLFSDIRNFTAFSEKVEPETVIEMLNTYLSVQAEIVRKHHGDIDKYVGDELIAIFQGKDMVINAVRCACDIHEKIEKLNYEQDKWDIHVGIGINTGDMVMGAMGSEERMDYTILGDNVNLGARLCSHAKACKTIISQASYDQLSDNYNSDYIIKLEPIHVKGKKQPIQIYEIKREYCLI